MTDTALLLAANGMNYIFLRDCFQNKNYPFDIVTEILYFLCKMNKKDIYYEAFKKICVEELEEGEYLIEKNLEESLSMLEKYLKENLGMASFDEDLFPYEFYKEIISDYFK